MRSLRVLRRCLLCGRQRLHRRMYWHLSLLGGYCSQACVDRALQKPGFRRPADQIPQAWIDRLLERDRMDTDLADEADHSPLWC